MNRRDAIKTLTSAAVATSIQWSPLEARQRLRFGYAAITWAGNDRQAMADIAAVGFPGIQLRTAAVDAFGERPAELKELLARHHLTMVALSSGNLGIDPALEAEELARHTRHARCRRSLPADHRHTTEARHHRRRLRCDEAGGSPSLASARPILASRSAITTTWAASVKRLMRSNAS